MKNILILGLFVTSTFITTTQASHFNIGIVNNANEVAVLKKTYSDIEILSTKTIAITADMKSKSIILATHPDTHLIVSNSATGAASNATSAITKTLFLESAFRAA